MTPEQRAVWDAVIVRDARKCRMCGRPGCVVHYIVPRSLCSAEDLWTPQNMMVICERHQTYAYTKAGRARQLAAMVAAFPEYGAWYAARSVHAGCMWRYSRTTRE